MTQYNRSDAQSTLLPSDSQQGGSSSLSFNDWNISNKISLAFGSIIGVCVVGGTTLGVQTLTASHAQKETDLARAKLTEIGYFLGELSTQQQNLQGWLIEGDAAHRRAVLGAQEELNATVGRMRSLTEGDTEFGALLNYLASANNTFQADIVDAELEYDEAQRRAALSDSSESEELQRELHDAAVALLNYDNTKLVSISENLSNKLSFLSITIILGSIFGTSLSILLALWMRRMVAQPSARISSTMRTVMRDSDGNDDIEIPYLDRKDEFGEIAATLLKLQENNKARHDAEMSAEKERESARRQREIADAERTRAEDEKQREAEDIQDAIDALGEALTALARGDLTHRIETEFNDQTDQLKKDFNHAIATLEDAMTVITANSGGISTSAGEMTQAADDLSQRTERQAATLEETASALDQITVTVRKTADGANQANVVVASARQDAEKSGEIVNSAVDAMEQISKSANQISQIIGVIDEIAFQTNLLALNAGVEAARAGEAGKGFAVVASEVRALAQRSAGAAKEIKGLIQTSSNHVESGVGLVGQAGDALKRIANQVSDITLLVSEIAASAQEQATGLSQVNSAVNQMDQVTQQNAAMVEETTAASHSLASESAELNRLVGNFKLSRAAVNASAVRAQGASKPKFSAAGSNAYMPSHAGTTTPDTAGRQTPSLMATQLKSSTQTAPAPYTDDEEDGWEEF